MSRDNKLKVSMVFEAVSKGPPKRKLFLWKERPIPNNAPPEIVSGWGFSVSSFDKNDEELPLWDTWEATYEEIIRYPSEYAPKDIEWVNAHTKERVDIYNL